MNVLVIVAHPNIQESTVNRRWVEELKNHPAITIQEHSIPGHAQY